jgi:hypothetical protein
MQQFVPRVFSSVLADLELWIRFLRKEAAWQVALCFWWCQMKQSRGLLVLLAKISEESSQERRALRVGGAPPLAGGDRSACPGD